MSGQIPSGLREETISTLGPEHAPGARRAAAGGAAVAVAIALLLGQTSMLIAQDSTTTKNKSGTMAGTPPQLIEITPSSGPAGDAYPLKVAIRGSGFMAVGNIVEFGPVRLEDLPASEANRITFAIPKSMQARGPAPPLVLAPGEYRVTVTTRSGTSNALMFTLTRGP